MDLITENEDYYSVLLRCCVISLTFGQTLMVLPFNYSDLQGFTLSSSFPLSLWASSPLGLDGTSGTEVILELGCNPKTKMP